MKRFRFSLRSMLLVVTLVALIAGGWAWVRSQYYWQLNALNAVLAEHPEIVVIRKVTNDDTFLEVERVYFCLADQPYLTYDFCIDHDDGEQEIRSALLDILSNIKPLPRTFPENPE